MIALLLSLGLAAAEPPCDSLPPLRQEVLSVAWVSPVGKRVGATSWVTVVPTRELQAWLHAQDADVPRMLQGLGLRKRSTPPRRAWKVTIFEVDAGALCRPAADLERGTPLGGLTVCPRNDKPVPGKHSGCGYTTDLADDSRGLDIFSIQWRDAAVRGFCVLPAERFLQGK